MTRTRPLPHGHYNDQELAAVDAWDDLLVTVTPSMLADPLLVRVLKAGTELSQCLRAACVRDLEQSVELARLTKRRGKRIAVSPAT